jgi:hypothetical protein
MRFHSCIRNYLSNIASKAGQYRFKLTEANGRKGRKKERKKERKKDLVN